MDPACGLQTPCDPDERVLRRSIAIAGRIRSRPLTMRICRTKVPTRHVETSIPVPAEVRKLKRFAQVPARWLQPIHPETIVKGMQSSQDLGNPRPRFAGPRQFRVPAGTHQIKGAQANTQVDRIAMPRIPATISRSTRVRF